MQRGAIAFVLGKSVSGIARCHFKHDAIARDLRNDAGRGDGKAQAVAADQRGLGDGEGEHGQAVDQGVIGRGGQCGKGAAHGFMGRFENVEPVDFLSSDHRRGPADSAVAGDLGIKTLAGLRRKFFRVVEVAMAETFRKHHDRGHHRAGERAAPGFIDSGNPHPTKPPQGAFVSEAASHRRR